MWRFGFVASNCSTFLGVFCLFSFFLREKPVRTKKPEQGDLHQLSSLVSQQFVGDAASLTSVHPRLPGSSEMFAHYLITELFKRVAS